MPSPTDIHSRLVPADQAHGQPTTPEAAAALPVTLPDAALLGNLSTPSASVTPLPGWVIGTRDCQLQLADDISIFVEDGKAILRLGDSRDPEGTPKNLVEFEVDPTALCGSFEEEVQNLSSLAPDFKRNGVFKSELFRRLSSDLSELFRIKTLQVSDHNIEIDGVLAEGAQVSGTLTDSILTLRGGPAHFESLNVSGSSTIYLDCENSSFSGVTIDRTSVLLGNLSGLKGGRTENRIQAHAVGLTVREADMSPEMLRDMFLGARLSDQHFNLSLLNDSVKRLSDVEVAKDESSLNAEFVARHVDSLHPRHGGVLPGPEIFARAGLVGVSTSIDQDSSTLRLELPLAAPIQTPQGATVNAVVLELPYGPEKKAPTVAPTFELPRISLHMSTEVPPSAERGRSLVSGDIEVRELGSQSRLFQLWALRAFLMAKRREVSDDVLASFAACGNDSLREVV